MLYAFGNSATTVGDANPYRYCGEYWDDESGRYYLRARYYFAKLGRVTECGTHDELMAADGKYAEMFIKQAENYTK